MNCISGTPRPPRPLLFSPSWICLMSLRQNGGSPLSNINSESLRGGGRGAYSEDFLTFHPRLWPLSPRSLYSVALRMFQRMFLIFQRSLPTPLSSPECPPTPQINTLLGFSTQLLTRRSPLLVQNPSVLRVSDGRRFAPLGTGFTGRTQE